MRRIEGCIPCQSCYLIWDQLHPSVLYCIIPNDYACSAHTPYGRYLIVLSTYLVATRLNSQQTRSRSRSGSVHHPLDGCGADIQYPPSHVGIPAHSVVHLDIPSSVPSQSCHVGINSISNYSMFALRSREATLHRDSGARYVLGGCIKVVTCPPSQRVVISLTAVANAVGPARWFICIETLSH